MPIAEPQTTEPANDPTDYSNVEKVALVLTSLSDDALARVLSSVDEKWRLQVQKYRLQYDKSPPEIRQVQQVLDELEDRVKEELQRLKAGDSSGSEAGAESLKKAKADAHKFRFKSSTEEFKADGDLLAQLQEWNTDELAAVLVEEHPGVVATVMNCLDIEKAGEVLNQLPLETSAKAFGRMMTPVKSDLLDSIIRPLLSKSVDLSHNPKSQIDNQGDDDKLEKMIDLLRHQHPSNRIKILMEFEKYDEETATRVKEKLYTINDLLMLDDQSIQQILKEVATDTLALGLNGAEPKVKDKVLRNMSKRARENLYEEMELSRSAPPPRVQEAQQMLLQELLRLGADGNLIWITD